MANGWPRPPLKSGEGPPPSPTPPPFFRAGSLQPTSRAPGGGSARHGAVYLEAIFSPIERTWRGVSWDELFTGYCDGAQEARERSGVEVRLTPEITRSAPLEDALALVRYAA